jgi:hypothetical protein
VSWEPLLDKILSGQDIQLVPGLGLEFHGAGAVIGDSSGKGFAAKAAVAKELVLGNMRFKNVSFFVVPDQEPFTSFPLDQRVATAGLSGSRWDQLERTLRPALNG